MPIAHLYFIPSLRHCHFENWVLRNGWTWFPTTQEWRACLVWTISISIRITRWTMAYTLTIPQKWLCPLKKLKIPEKRLFFSNVTGTIRLQFVCYTLPSSRLYSGWWPIEVPCNSKNHWSAGMLHSLCSGKHGLKNIRFWKERQRFAACWERCDTRRTCCIHSWRRASRRRSATLAIRTASLLIGRCSLQFPKSSSSATLFLLCCENGRSFFSITITMPPSWSIQSTRVTLIKMIIWVKGDQGPDS